jgi:nitrous oxide reductase accessory protein NosL
MPISNLEYSNAGFTVAVEKCSQAGRNGLPDNEKMMLKYIQMILILCGLLATGLSWGGETAKPSPSDKCPVCGMFVAKYPDFLATIRFSDGSQAFFDGSKDMFKYYFEMSRYEPAKKISDIASISVTDYYTLTLINAHEATYIIGSDVYGPMGRELVPFEKEADAREFMRDHKGQSLVKFNEVALPLVKKLD